VKKKDIVTQIGKSINDNRKYKVVTPITIDASIKMPVCVFALQHLIENSEAMLRSKARTIETVNATSTIFNLFNEFNLAPTYLSYSPFCFNIDSTLSGIQMPPSWWFGSLYSHK